MKQFRYLDKLMNVRDYFKNGTFLFIAIWTFFLSSCERLEEDKYPTKEELDKRYNAEWNKPEYQLAHTAKNETYLTQEEKEVFYYLNLARIDPTLFAKTYVTGFEGEKGYSKGYAWDERKESLIKELSSMQPLALIYPDLGMYELAYCFSYEGGLLGIIGHDRNQTSCDGGYIAECSQYGGLKNGLSIVMSLLIDAGENNAALGHRRICLRDAPYGMGVSIQTHKTYSFNTVLDFSYSYENIAVPDYTEQSHGNYGFYDVFEITFFDNITGFLFFHNEEGYYYVQYGETGYMRVGSIKVNAIKILYVCKKYDISPSHFFE